MLDQQTIERQPLAFRLSPQQRRILSLAASSLSPAFSSQLLLHLRGHCDPLRLQQALLTVVSRHEILRTHLLRLRSFKLPVQVIDPLPQLHWQLLSLDHSAQAQPACCTTGKLEDCAALAELAASERAAAAAAGAAGDASSGSGAVLRAVLVECGAESRVLVLSAPAVCADARTMRLIVEEMAESYASAAGAEGVSREEGEAERGEVEEVVQYADVTEVFNELAGGEESEGGREYWKEREEEWRGGAELRVWSGGGGAEDKEECSEGGAGSGIGVERVVVGGVVGGVEGGGEEEEWELVGSWMVLMWRLTGQHSITIGGRSDGRVAEELENALGPYARWLPITCQLRETYLFSEIASSIKRAFEEASQWQESFSWEQLERERRDESPLHFSVGFEYEKLPGRALDAASCSISFKRLYSYGERFDAKLTCVRQGDTLTAEIHYDERLLSKDDAKRLASLFRQLFLSARSRPDTPIAQLEWLDEEQRQWLLNLNLTEAEYPRDTCVHELFERQAERTPDRIAVVHEQSRLTYGELNRRAELLARGLRGIGVGPETRVALCLDRSTDLIVGLLGILKAGAAYVPFEPDVPQTRLAAMLENADVRVAVTERQHAERFSELTAHVLCVEEFREEACAVADTATKTRVVSGNLAYVIYTSGSTGRPKGVAVEHRQLVNYIHGITRKLELSPDSSFALVSTIAADLGGTVLFPALCNGGTLHVISHERASNPARLGQYFREHQIDCLKIVPSHLSALLDCARPRDVLPLRRLVLGGEALNWRLVERLAELAPECRVMNHYGPTETTIGVLTCVVREEERGHASATVPTGRPLSNTQAYIVDERLRLVPAGVTGELLIGGEGVARGYLNGASLSAEKFIPDAFGRVPGGRVYRTGDLARYLPDGRIEFLGRRDHQVKVRGYRIEMGEIEATLAKHPSVREAAVAALDDTSGNRNLVAFVSARRGQRLDVAALRVFLQDALPHYMVPSRILLLDALPLTPNGKIDRQSLPRLAAEHRDETAPAYVPPGSDAEKIVAAAWKEVLRVEQVGLYDNFFDLGGHSLFIIQVHGRLSEQFKRDFPVMDLFKYTTVSSLAKYLSSSTEEALPASQSQSRADGRRAAMIQRQHRYAV